MVHRYNGLSAPYSAPQIGAWAALLLTAVGFPLFFTPVMPLEATIPVTIIFMVLVLLAAYYGILTQAVDPVDLRLAHAFVERGDIPTTGLYKMCNKSFPEPNTDENTKQCWICDLQVAQHSMHCKFCNKCVGNFDHHCMWLNTCIGERNYKLFFRCMLFLFAVEVSQLGVASGLFVDSFLGPTHERAEAWFGIIACRIVWAWFIVFNIVSILLIGQLLAFHVKLQRMRLSTYQFIIQDHKEKRSLQERIDRMESQRTNMMAKAYAEKRPRDAYKLWVGRQCRSAGCAECDSMEIPAPPDPEAGFSHALGSKEDLPEDKESDATRVAQESSPLEEEESGGGSDENVPESPSSASRRFL